MSSLCGISPLLAYGKVGFPSTGLSAHWPMEGNANDSSGGGNNGTSTNITYNSGNGKISQGAGLNGTTSYIGLTQGSLYNPTGSFSINAWVKPTNFTGFPAIMFNYNILTGDTYGRGFGFRITSSGKIESLMMNNSGVVLTGATALSTGVYSMVTLVRTGSTGTKLYVNGVQDASDSSTFNPGYTTDANIPTIGAVDYYQNHVHQAMSNFFNGAMDEVSFYGSTALTAADVLNLYNSGIGRTYP